MPAQTHSKFHTKAYSLTTTNDTTIYTVPNNYSGVIRLLLASNTGSSNANITIKWYHADDAETHTIIGSEQIAGNSHEKLLAGDSPFFVHAGDILKATAGTANVFEMTVSVEEYYDPNRG
jgi:hypothetical protein